MGKLAKDDEIMTTQVINLPGNDLILDLIVRLEQLNHRSLILVRKTLV